MDLADKAWNAAVSLFGFCKVHAAYIYEMDDKLEQLRSKMVELGHLSADVLTRVTEGERTREKQRTYEVKGWLEKVEKLKEVLAGIQKKHSQESKCFGCCPTNCISSYKLGKEIVTTLNSVIDEDGMLTRGKRFFDQNTIIVDNLPPNLINPMPLGETTGLDLMLNQVWSCLEDGNVSTIGLHGMGGVGKTTLLTGIRNEFEKRNHDFEVVLWVVVSKDLDTNKIMNDIRQRLRIEDKDWNEISPDRRVEKIYQVLRGKRFVLMLDDLWEKLVLEKVGVPQPSDPQYKSKILFTTRSEDVCAKMNAKPLEVKCLSEEEAFSLFSKEVKEETLKHHREIQNLAREIAKECDGLPLALVTVGSAMAGVRDVDAWREAKNDLSGCTWTALGVEKIFSRLKFSYDKLPNETHRRCFLYCSLYPEDYEINVDSLIDRWMGEGFLSGDNTNKPISDMYLQGKSIIEKLKLSCLLEGVVEKEFWDRPCIKMHDVIRDMALWIARDEDRKKEKVAVEGEALAMTSEVGLERLKGVERISLINADVDGRWRVPVCPNLITFCMQQRRKCMNDYSNVQYMTKLKVLVLLGSDIANIPPEFGKLINLEFLDLSQTEIRHRLPIELKNLKKLRIWLMEFVEFSLALIPLEVIESLEQLKVFRFTSSDPENTLTSEEERRFLEKLESLPKLEKLCMELTTMAGMHKLHESPRLRGCLTNYTLWGIKEAVEMRAVLECWSTMKHLKDILLWGLENIMEGSSITYNGRLRNLRRVVIWGCHSITHLTWLRYAPLLERLSVEFCDSIEEVVKEDGGLDRDGDENDIFPNLTHLNLQDLSKLKIIHKKALAFPFLKLIRVIHCPNLRELPLKWKNALISIEGEEEWWNNLEWRDPSLKAQLPFIDRF